MIAPNDTGAGHGTLSAVHDGCRCGWCESTARERRCACATCRSLRDASPYVEPPRGELGDPAASGRTGTSWNIPSDDERAVAPRVTTRAAVEAYALADSATALDLLGDRQAAERALGKSRQLWTPGRTDATGDLDQVGACLELARGRLDSAEQFAVASVRRWEGISNQRARTNADILLATVHIRAGERDGLQLAHSAIAKVTKLSSVRARQQYLTPLAIALEARPGSDAKQLARTARQVTTTRA